MKCQLKPGALLFIVSKELHHLQTSLEILPVIDTDGNDDYSCNKLN